MATLKKRTDKLMENTTKHGKFLFKLYVYLLQKAKTVGWNEIWVRRAWFKRLPWFFCTTLTNKKNNWTFVACANAMIRESTNGKKINVVHFDKTQDRTRNQLYNPKKLSKLHHSRQSSSLRRRNNNCWYYRTFEAKTYKYRPLIILPVWAASIK